MKRQIELVAFDVGGVLVDETRMWKVWADLLAIPFDVLKVELDAVIARRVHHREVFARLAPHADLAVIAATIPYRIEARDLFPDVRPALQALQKAGLRTAVAANQPAESQEALRQADLGLEFVQTSEQMGVAKPDPAFFARLADAAGLAPERIAYVGDRIDNDVLPANAAGMVSVFLPRGPWGRSHAQWPQAAEADLRVTDLIELTTALAA